VDTANEPSAEPIEFAGSSLGKYRHVCAFFTSPKEEYETLLPFVRAGLEQGERAYHVLPDRYRDEHLEQLRGAGIDVEKAQQTRQLEIALPDETYLLHGTFSKEGMRALIRRLSKRNRHWGFRLPAWLHTRKLSWRTGPMSTIGSSTKCG
jgi:hypothetical protein